MQFLFYDLETSGISAKWQRIMQFAARRTDLDLKPVGKPVEHLIALTDEVLPEPAAIMLTGITPQISRRDGVTEAAFWQELTPVFAERDTCVIGFNNIRFDDEFLRYSLWRSFRDPYAWAWENGNSRWDLLDMVRMTRALRPDGIEWPSNDKGPTNRLEELAKANGLKHDNAHSALGDVNATIELARLLKKTQPKLWDWLLGLRLKKPAQAFIEGQGGQPFVYTSGSYPKEHLHTSVVSHLGTTERGAWVYDLRVDPDDWLGRSDEELQEADENRERLPVKQLQFNRAPAVAPLSVLDAKSIDRLELDMARVETNHKKLAGKDIGDFLRRAENLREARFAAYKISDPDGQLYDGFLEDSDRAKCQKVSGLDATGLADYRPDFTDKRLGELFLRYKARNFPAALSEAERLSWETYRVARLQADYGMNAERYYQELQSFSENPELTDGQKSLLTELDLYAQSVLPVI